MSSRSEKAGLSPGTLIYTGDQTTQLVKVTAFDYGKEQFQDVPLQEVTQYLKNRDSQKTLWLNVDGLHQVALIQEIGTHFDLHPLLLEDIVNPHQRPKLEEYPQHLFVILKMLYYSPPEIEIEIEQVTIVLGNNFVLTFQEKEGDIFQSLRNRLQSRKTVLSKGADYLVYCLIDAIVDYYFVILERLGENIEDLEEEVLSHPQSTALTTLHSLKREVIFLRKSIWPLREVIKKLQSEDVALVDKSVHIYFRDIYDHTIQIMDTIETFREMLSSMLDIYMTSISNRMNEVMKVLTMIATIFIPLSFVAGVYGMNFKHMPELEWRWGYALVWTIMISLVTTMIFYFRKKKWL